MRRVMRSYTLTARSTWLAQSRQKVPSLSRTVAGSPTLEESNLRDDPKTEQMTKGTTRTPGWHPEETASQLPLNSRTDCFINATPTSRPEAGEWAPSVWQAR